MTETLWSAKPKMFTIWSFTENICQPGARHEALGEGVERRDLSMPSLETKPRGGEGAGQVSAMHQLCSLTGS